MDAEKASDERAAQLSFEYLPENEKDMQYPGQIKVTVIQVEIKFIAYKVKLCL